MKDKLFEVNSFHKKWAFYLQENVEVNFFPSALGRVQFSMHLHSDILSASPASGRRFGKLYTVSKFCTSRVFENIFSYIYTERLYGSL